MESLLPGSFPQLSSSLPSGGNYLGETKFKVGHSPREVQVYRCRARKILERQCVFRFQRHHSGFSVKKSTIYQENNAKFLVHAASGQPFESESGAYNPESTSKSVKNALDAFYRFSRPHTLIGTVKSKFVI